MKYPSKLLLLIFLYSVNCFSSNDLLGYNKILANNEDANNIPPDEVEGRIKNKVDLFKKKVNDYQFGVTSIDQPFFNKDTDFEKVDNAYKLLSEIGVDSVKSGAADWSRIATPNGDFNNLDNLHFQLEEIKKYNLSSSFIIGYPPIGMGNYSKSIRTSVDNKFIGKYQEYVSFIISYLRPYNVKYVEVGNEVDAGSHWWIHGTPAQYLNEVKILSDAIKRDNSSLKIAVFSSTYARNKTSAPHEGRNFIDECLSLGIDEFADAYSLHHFTFPKDDGLVGFMQSELSSRSIKKPILDTEQMDTTVRPGFVSPPYDIIKLFAYGFFKYNIPHIDYFMARDAFVEPKVYPSGFTQGLFDINWKPKPRLLAYAMSVDAMKGRTPVSIGSGKGYTYFILEDKMNVSKYKYSLLIWSNINIKKMTLSSGQIAESWDLKITREGNVINLGVKPTVIFSNNLSSLQTQLSEVL